MSDVEVFTGPEGTSRVSVRREYEIPAKILLDTVLEDYLLSNAIRYWAKSFTIDASAHVRTLTVNWVEEGQTEETWDSVGFHRIAWAMAALAFSEEDFGINPYDRRRIVRFFQEIDDPDEEFPGGDIDSEIADYIIQVALFREVRFS